MSGLLSFTFCHCMRWFVLIVWTLLYCAVPPVTTHWLSVNDVTCKLYIITFIIIIGPSSVLIHDPIYTYSVCGRKSRFNLYLHVSTNSVVYVEWCIFLCTVRWKDWVFLFQDFCVLSTVWMICFHLSGLTSIHLLLLLLTLLQIFLWKRVACLCTIAH